MKTIDHQGDHIEFGQIDYHLSGLSGLGNGHRVQSSVHFVTFGF